MGQRREVTQILQDLYQHTPRHVSLSELDYTLDITGALITFKGQADSLVNAFAYTEAMRPAKLLNTMQLDNVQQIARRDRSVVEFRANCTLRNK